MRKKRLITLQALDLRGAYVDVTVVFSYVVV